MTLSIIDKAVNRIWNDLSDRKGVGNELDMCDEEIQQEIKDTIKSQIDCALSECLEESDKPTSDVLNNS